MGTSNVEIFNSEDGNNADVEETAEVLYDEKKSLQNLEV
jgi:hypothetical protein